MDWILHYIRTSCNVMFTCQQVRGDWIVELLLLDRRTRCGRSLTSLSMSSSNGQPTHGWTVRELTTVSAVGPTSHSLSERSAILLYSQTGVGHASLNKQFIRAGITYGCRGVASIY